MSLDDVIKTKGSKKEGQGKEAAGARGGAGSRQTRGGRRHRGGKAGKEQSAKPANSGGDRRVQRVGAAAMAPALKAAAAAAKATAAKAGATEKADKAVKTERAPKAKAPAKASGAAPKGTEDKLGMTLEDMIKFEGKGKGGKAKVPAEQAEGGGRKRKGMMKLRKTDTKQATKAAKAKAEKGGAQKTKGLRMDDDWRSGRAKGRGKGEDWLEGWRAGKEVREERKGGMYAEWGSAWAGKRRADDWGRDDEKRSRTENWGRGADDGWGRGRGEGRPDRDRAWADYGSSSGSARGLGYGDGGRSWGRDRLEWDQERPASRPARVVEEPRWPAVATKRPAAAAGSLTIRVCNVPKNLDWRDLKDAFEDTGRVTRCEVERGVALISFESNALAKKAVQTFDRGELNGQTIFVTLEP